ncbi:hypothetical protein EVAR_96888_1 [Eumeta japonica]|uniref:Uncharacterized protein n=1 Tax=Eumeta variegata TaxID=151549 RepID=A0A4C1WFJ5_EUMVA|nr:hypothetical protein EVAR_96888_1 [Eumeta japonica]
MPGSTKCTISYSDIAVTDTRAGRPRRAGEAPDIIPPVTEDINGDIDIGSASKGCQRDPITETPLSVEEKERERTKTLVDDRKRKTRIRTRGEHLCGGEANIVCHAYYEADSVWSFCENVTMYFRSAASRRKFIRSSTEYRHGRGAGLRGDDRPLLIYSYKSWIYCYDPETKRQSAQWVFPFEELPTKAKRGRSAGKKMVASFCEMTEIMQQLF